MTDQDWGPAALILLGVLVVVGLLAWNAQRRWRKKK